MAIEIDIEYCNNIDTASIKINKNKLNIKFAPNGTGKSTIAKAILYSTSKSSNKLSDLLPFKLHDSNPQNKQPNITISEDLTNVMCFNEDYVEQFTFQKNELINNSFDIFIRDSKYKKLEEDINNVTDGIRKPFTNNDKINDLINKLKELSGAFIISNSGISKISKGMKALSEGNKIEHIPAGLESFTPFIKSNKCVDWIDWQTRGYETFSDLSNSCCPFCSSNSTDKQSVIQNVSKEYDKNVIKNLKGLLDIINKLGNYFSDKTKQALLDILSLKEGLKEEHENFIKNIKVQIDNFITRLDQLKNLSSFSFKQNESVKETLSFYKLNLKNYPALDSEDMNNIVSSINNPIDTLKKRAGVLQGKINTQQSRIKKLITEHEKDINNFLTYAGYNYEVKISNEKAPFLLQLFHITCKKSINGGVQHLSYGERNAFAIVLFMYECLSKKPDLIILDDPISSFDKNKKFAILEMLFRKDSKNCLKGDTVLMLTHDMEPIIDTLKSVKKQFNNQVTASYLQYKDNSIIEHTIEYKDIKTFGEICHSKIQSNCHAIIKLIYLRRYYEITDNKSDAYQVLSNLFHLRTQLTDSREGMTITDSPIMSEQVKQNGNKKIKDYIESFNYELILSEMSDKTMLQKLYKESLNGYEKLQLFRLLNRLLKIEVNNSVIKKFINETYHIENEFICQLDPDQFDLIPEYVIKECDKILRN